MNQKLIAAQAFPYAGRNLKVGDPFEASEKDAIILTGAGKARRAGSERINSKDLGVEEIAQQSGESKRRYRRLDMRAE